MQQTSNFSTPDSCLQELLATLDPLAPSAQDYDEPPASNDLLLLASIDSGNSSNGGNANTSPVAFTSVPRALRMVPRMGTRLNGHSTSEASHPPPQTTATTTSSSTEPPPLVRPQPCLPVTRVKSASSSASSSRNPMRRIGRKARVGPVPPPPPPETNTDSGSSLYEKIDDSIAGGAPYEPLSPEIPPPVPPKDRRRPHSHSRARKGGSAHVYDLYDRFAQVMYTTPGNLQHTMLVQQQLFSAQQSSRRRQAISRSNSNCESLEKGGGAGEEGAMEWVVKRRPDGSRYITRRPVRSRALKEKNSRRPEEERGAATDEEAAARERRRQRKASGAPEKSEKHRRRRKTDQQQQQPPPPPPPVLSRSISHPADVKEVAEVEAEAPTLPRPHPQESAAAAHKSASAAAAAASKSSGTNGQPPKALRPCHKRPRRCAVNNHGAATIKTQPLLSVTTV